LLLQFTKAGHRSTRSNCAGQSRDNAWRMHALYV